MNQKIRDHLENYCRKKGFKVSTDKDLMEVITESKILESEITQTHRWYSDTEIVTEVDGMFLRYEGFHITGDNSYHDLGLEYDLNSVVEVEKATRVISYYKEV